MWTDSENFGRLEARLTPDALAVLGSCLEPFEAPGVQRGSQTRSPLLATRSMPQTPSSPWPKRAVADPEPPRLKTQTLVRIRVDLGALNSGHPVPGESCEIPGIASVPVALARQILGDSLLELVFTEGQDLKAVCTNSRHIQQALRIALEERDQTCCVPDCDMSDPLEIDHYRTDFAKGGETKLENLARLCGPTTTISRPTGAGD